MKLSLFTTYGKSNVIIGPFSSASFVHTKLWDAHCTIWVVLWDTPTDKCQPFCRKLRPKENQVLSLFPVSLCQLADICCSCLAETAKLCKCRGVGKTEDSIFYS